MIDKTRRLLAQDSLRRFVDEMRALGCADNEILDELNSYMRGDETHDADS